MILCDPFAVNFLATSALKILTALINNESLPREHTVLLLLLRMLELGLHAWDMIDRQASLGIGVAAAVGVETVLAGTSMMCVPTLF